MIVGGLLDLGLPLEDLRAALGTLPVDHEIGAERVLRAGVWPPSAKSPRPTRTEHARGRARARAPARARARPEHQHEHHSLKQIASYIQQSELSAARTRNPSVQAACRSGSRDPRDAARPGPPARSRRPRLHHRHRRRGVRARGAWCRQDAFVAAERRRRYRSMRSRHLSGSRPGDGSAAGRRPRVCGGLANGTGDPHRGPARDRIRAAYGPLPPLTIRGIGYRAGDRDPERHPNVLRLIVGDDGDSSRERIVQIACEIDDMNPQLFGPLMDRLQRARWMSITRRFR